jgi:hypothetical protein
MAGFPINVIDVLHARFKELIGLDIEIIDRPLRYTDPSRSVGLFAVDWVPVEGSYEIGKGFEPTLARYNYRIQALVKHTDEEEGRALYASDSKIIKAILYRDAQLVQRLTELQETNFGSIERAKRWGVRAQRFLNNELQGQFIYLATTELWLEAETVPQ